MDIESQKYHKEWYEKHKHKRPSPCPCGCGRPRRLVTITRVQLLKYAERKCTYKMQKIRALDRAVAAEIKRRGLVEP